MTDDERDELLIELKTAVVGIPGTDDGGMATTIKGINEHLIRQNGKIDKNKVANLKTRAALGGLIAFLAGAGLLEGFGIINLFG